MQKIKHGKVGLSYNWTILYEFKDIWFPGPLCIQVRYSTSEKLECMAHFEEGVKEGLIKAIPDFDLSDDNQDHLQK